MLTHGNLLAALLATAVPAAAQYDSLSAPPRSSTITWEQCIELARRRNPDLSASRSALAAGRASYYESFNGFLPQVSLSNGIGDSDSSDGASRWSAQGNASLDLFSLSRAATIRSASAAVRSAEAELRQASAALRFNLRRAFAQLLFAQENADVAARIHGIRERDARLVGLRYDSGRESRGNMLRARAQLAQAEADLAQSRRDLRTARLALGRHLGDAAFTEFAATGTLTAQSVPVPADPRALADLRPDVAAQRAAVEAARAAVSQAKSPLWPSLSASYSRSAAGPSEFPSRRYSWSVNGLLSYPLFGGGLTSAYYSTIAARRGLERAEARLQAVRDQAAVDVDAAWSDLERAVDQVRVQAALLEAARQRNDEADVRYASGLLAFENWELIVSDRVGTERQALQARLNATVAEAAWRQALGTGLGDL